MEKYNTLNTLRVNSYDDFLDSFDTEDIVVLLECIIKRLYWSDGKFKEEFEDSDMVDWQAMHRVFMDTINLIYKAAKKLRENL